MIFYKNDNWQGEVIIWSLYIKDLFINPFFVDNLTFCITCVPYLPVLTCGIFASISMLDLRTGVSEKGGGIDC